MANNGRKRGRKELDGRAAKLDEITNLVSQMPLHRAILFADFLEAVTALARARQALADELGETIPEFTIWSAKPRAAGVQS